MSLLKNICAVSKTAGVETLCETTTDLADKTTFEKNKKWLNNERDFSRKKERV